MIIWSFAWRGLLSCLVVGISLSNLLVVLKTARRFDAWISGPRDEGFRSWLGFAISVTCVLVIELAMIVVAALIVRLIWWGMMPN